MKTSEMTVFAFAQFSYLRDKNEGLFDDSDDPQEFDLLDQDEKDSYLEEAIDYMMLSPSEWPDDILERLGHVILLH